MATTYFKNAPAGGAANALDSIDGTDLADGDRAYVFLPSGLTISLRTDDIGAYYYQPKLFDCGSFNAPAYGGNHVQFPWKG